MKHSTVLQDTGKNILYRQKHTQIHYVLIFNSIHIWENEPIIYTCTDAIWSTVIILIDLFFIRESTCGSWIYIHLFRGGGQGGYPIPSSLPLSPHFPPPPPPLPSPLSPTSLSLLPHFPPPFRFFPPPAKIVFLFKN